MARLAWLTPDEIPTDTVERRLCIPNSPQILSVVTGALLPLAYAENWEQYGDVTPDEIAARMSLMIEEFLAVTGLCKMPIPILIDDYKTQNTQSGTATTGSWYTRVLNTLTDLFPYGAALASNAFTLPAGLWLIEWDFEFFGVGSCQTRLFSVTENGVVQYGSSESSNATSSSSVHSDGRTIQNNVSSTQYRIEGRVQTTLANEGNGRRANFGTERYGGVKCTKLD